MAGPRLQRATVSGSPSGDLAVQLVAARYAHAPLESDDIRDVKLVVLLMGVESAQLGSAFGLPAVVPYSADVLGRLATLGGLSRGRVGAAITRLLEAGALTVQEGPDPNLVFAERVLQPPGAAEYLDWRAVVDRLRGHSPALLVLRSLLDRLRLPWEWTSMTYQDLAERCCYSLGMVRHGADQLLEAGVLERRAHAGRGHEYRCSSWALGRGAPAGGVKAGAIEPTLPSAAPGPHGVESRTVPPVIPQALVGTGGEMTVEVGDLVVRVPGGTVIRMQVTPDGATVYHVGPHLRLTHRPAS